MAGGGATADGGAEITLEYTPTWIVAAVCCVIVVISLVFERLLHSLGKRLKKGSKKPLYDALLKIKEELMLLGFISLLLSVFQGPAQKICVQESIMHHMLPCPLPASESAAGAKYGAAMFTGVLGGARRLLAGGGAANDYCQKKGKVPIISVEAIHQLHIFIFVLAVTHVALSVITAILGIAQTRNWRRWEEEIQLRAKSVDPQMIKHVQEFKFIRDHFKGHEKRWHILGWMRSFFKQFYGSVTEEDYTAMRLGFVMKHCKGHPKFNFYKYMIRAFEADFKKVVGISWYLWTLLVVFLLLNVHGWYVYIWLSLAPFILLLVVGSKMEHIITELAVQVAQRHTAIEGDVAVTPSDDFFWFHRPKLVLHLIHIVLFQNAFEIAFFFWLLVTYGFSSCIMGRPAYVIARLVISVVSQLLCAYSTLPLYAIVSHMGNSFKKAIFDDNVSEGLVNWAQNARRRKGKKTTNSETGDSSVDGRYGGSVQMTNA
ncbi:hypothetical protein HU200_015692 [Digitaria exilis]|uniref:MLO-like protein n=1 Tax=Digitaria exilis TaxID=1010633 RepID=A0A835KIR4_9POAL|nr:hypothetical protein HU200_015692 [Digitaria exilis]